MIATDLMWNQLIHFCLPLCYYHIKLDEFDNRRYIQQIKGCTNLSIATVNLNQENKEMSTIAISRCGISAIEIINKKKGSLL